MRHQAFGDHKSILSGNIVFNVAGRTSTPPLFRDIDEDVLIFDARRERSGKVATTVTSLSTEVCAFRFAHVNGIGAQLRMKLALLQAPNGKAGLALRLAWNAVHDAPMPFRHQTPRSRRGYRGKTGAVFCPIFFRR